MQIKDFFYSLNGEWELQRSVTNNHFATGICRYSNISKNLLVCYEKGLLNNKDSFSKEYFYELDPLNKAVNIYFDIELKRLFVQVQSVIGSNQTSIHLCGKDIYKYQIFLDDNNNFATECQVIGPFKNYTIKTSLRRKKDQF